MKRWLIALCLLLPFSAHAEKLHVVTSFSILQDMTQQVGGDAVQVTSLVGPDSDVHAFSPTPADARSVAQAQVMIVNGLRLEGWMDRLLAASGFKGRLIVASAGVTPLMVGGAPDPHAWQDLANGETYVRNIRDGLIQADPAHAALYAKNAERYLNELTSLDTWVREHIAAIPLGKRSAITSHDSLGYFAHAYGITLIAPLGLSTDGDISARDMARLIDQIRGGKVRAVFLENMSNPQLIETLAHDGGAVVGGTLYSDALSAPGGPAPSYTAMFRHNVKEMAKAMVNN